MTRATLRVDADLRFESRAATGGPDLSGTVTASGTTIHVSVSSLPPLGSPGLARQLAGSLASRGLRLVVSTPAGMVVALGDVRATWWHRLFTRSPYIQIGNVRRLRRVLGGTGRGTRTSQMVAPPPTLLPLFPTVHPLQPRRVTTTHDPRGGGRPRLVFGLSAWPQQGESQRVEYLTRARTTLGSSEECDVRVAGLQPLHAVIHRTDQDEYVLSHVAEAGTSTVAGIPAEASLLRTGAAIALDGVAMTYVRAEFADHGRPHGGRLGGEIDRQRPQRKPRPHRPGAVGRPRTNRDPGRYYP